MGTDRDALLAGRAIQSLTFFVSVWSPGTEIVTVTWPPEDRGRVSFAVPLGFVFVC